MTPLLANLRRWQSVAICNRWSVSTDAALLMVNVSPDVAMGVAGISAAPLTA
jgi:hypothetical protein